MKLVRHLAKPLLAVIGLATAGVAVAQSAPDAPKAAQVDPAAPLPSYIANSSYTESNGDRVMQYSVTVPAKVDELYSLFTSAEGFKRWAAKWAVVDFRMGGFIEGAFTPNAKEGDPTNVRNEIISYVKNKVIVERGLVSGTNMHNQDLYRSMTIVLTFDDLGTSSRLTATAGPFKTGERWDAVYAHARRTYPAGLIEIHRALTPTK